MERNAVMFLGLLKFEIVILEGVDGRGADKPEAGETDFILIKIDDPANRRKVRAAGDVGRLTFLFHHLPQRVAHLPVAGRIRLRDGGDRRITPDDLACKRFKLVRLEGIDPPLLVFDDKPHNAPSGVFVRDDDFRELDRVRLQLPMIFHRLVDGDVERIGPVADEADQQAVGALFQ